LLDGKRCKNAKHAINMPWSGLGKSGQHAINMPFCDRGVFIGGRWSGFCGLRECAVVVLGTTTTAFPDHLPPINTPRSQNGMLMACWPDFPWPLHGMLMACFAFLQRFPSSKFE
jgi:hypothetical protein